LKVFERLRGREGLRGLIEGKRKKKKEKRRIVWISFLLDDDPLSLSEDLESVVSHVTDDDSVEMIDGDSLWILELDLSLSLSSPSSPRSKGRDPLSLRIKDLNPVVSPVKHEDVVVMIDGHSLRVIKMTVF